MLFAPNDELGRMTMVLVKEHDSVHRDYDVDARLSSPLPASMQLLLEELQKLSG